MFIGTYYHKLEGKGRVSLPKAFRLGQNPFAPASTQPDSAPEQPQDWVITPGLDGGLFIFPAQDFLQELNKLAQLEFNKADQRNFIRLMTNQAQPATTDKTGRLLIPEHLLQLAKIQKDVVIVGSLTRLELWDQTAYHQLLDQINRNAASIAERIEWGSAGAQLPAGHPAAQTPAPLSPRPGETGV